MSAKIKVLANSPAFPHTHGVRSVSGLTKREYFAAHLLPTAAAGRTTRPSCAEEAAAIAIQFADELIRQLDATSAEES